MTLISNAGRIIKPWVFFNQHPLIHRQRSSRCPGISRLRRPAAGRSWTAIECSGWNK